MRPHTELVAGSVLVLLLAVGAGTVGLRRQRLTDADDRRSTFLPGPAGAMGFAQALERLGVRVEPLRRPSATLESEVPARTLTAFVGPSSALDAREGRLLAGLRRDLLLAGPGAAAAFRCLGYDLMPRIRRPLEVAPPAGAEARAFPAVFAVLLPRASAVAVDSSGAEDSAPVTCTAPAARTVDTLVRTTGGRIVALRAEYTNGRAVTLVADDRLFANRALRDTGAGPFALGLVVPRYDRIVVDEYHHGYDASSSLAGAATDWTVRSPWGWAVLQLTVVGVLALLAAGIRFGPIRAGIERRRRSPLEHVRALATALAAARGHDVAVRLIVQGLRRRLSRAGHASRSDLRPWLDGLAPAVRTPRGRTALATLTTVTGGAASAQDVLRAAEAVETLWEELAPT